ncbi:uncharacterized protein LOC144100031 isoform X2 [Amblyomma americanum]
MASEFTDTSRLTSQLTDTSRFNTTSLADQSAMASQPMSVPQYYPPPDLLTVQTQVAGDIHHLASAAPALARIIEAQIAAEREGSARRESCYLCALCVLLAMAFIVTALVLTYIGNLINSPPVTRIVYVTATVS